jgi:radical SAM-linked protein
MRVRLTFSKTEAMRFTGHLDLQRTLERAIRRANLPLAYSEGFNRRGKLMLADALPLGFTSEGELADLWLDEAREIGAVREALERASPPGIQLHKAEEIEIGVAKLPNALRRAEYVVMLLAECGDLDERVGRLLAAGTLPREKRRKGKLRPYDLRPLIHAIRVIERDGENRQRLFMQLNAQEGATGRPDEVLNEIGIEPEGGRFHRVGLLLEGELREAVK